MSAEKKPAMLPAMLAMKCPSCRKGFVYKNKSYVPLGKCLELKEECEVCGQKLISERNNGGGINYALTAALIFLNLCWYWPIFGLRYDDNSVVYYLITSVSIALIMQPFLMRLSRMIYLYLYVAFGHSRRVVIEDDPE